MDPPDFVVIVVRAWREAGGLRIRVLANGGSGRQWVVGSVAEVRDVLEAIIAELPAPAPERPATPPQTSR